ncbi:MAG: hypothetical protein HOM44_01160 [Gammaproteobacteria bacterium]|jgi:hypothetical protein|nr:hypothetical protein [Gammaproteobacteria bacterium]MBT5686682.1 hypothetical protein [Gammaproteobacteria bacterium]MBT5723985.1 hypothetical protein [Gammaproteobacteria bacterium]
MMATDTSQQYLLDAYLGEIRGEATFRLLAETLPERADDLHMLAEVERLTAAYLSDYLLSPVSTEAEAACRAAAKRRVTAMSIDSWAALLEEVTPIVQAALEKFKVAEAQAPRELRHVYQAFTAHELVLADYLRLEQDGNGGAHLLENYIERVAPRTS